MRKLLLSVIACAIFTTASRGQIVGSNCFLQGRYVEAGLNPFFGFGTATSPATYHSLTAAGTAVPVPGNQLGLVYDLGHDGWYVGTPNATGDYVLPGLPSEGWVLEVAGAQATVSHPGTTTTGSLTVTGGITGYTSSGGTATAYWDGLAAGGSLGIHMETKIDTNASAVVMTLKLRNLSAVPLTSIYFMRYTDPDNLSWNGGASSTQNTIVYQQGDALNRAFVNSGTTTPYVSNFSLGAVDSRAKVVTLASLVPTASVSASYTSGTGTVLSAVGSTSFADQAIAIMFSLGTINAGDSTQLSYAYIFNGVPGFDSVFFPCGMMVGGTAIPDNDTICGASALVLTATGYTTGSGISYQWQSSPDSVTWTNIAGATSVPYTVSSSSSTQYYRIVSTCAAGSSSVQSPGVRVVYQPLCPCASVVAGAASASVASGCASTAITLNAAGYTATGVTYRWQSSPDSATWSDIPGATTIPYSFTGISASTYYRLVVTCLSGAPQDSTAGVRISFIACSCPGLAVGSVATSASAACSTTVVTLSATGYTSTGTSLRWQASYDSVNWTDLPVTTPTYIFTGLGVTTFYRIKLTCLANGDTAFSAGKIVQWYLCPPASVKQVAGGRPQIYPNPVNDEVTVETQEGGFTNLVIVNSMGQEVLRQNIVGKKTIVKVGLLPVGVYQMVVRGDRTSEVVKILKL